MFNIFDNQQLFKQSSGGKHLTVEELSPKSSGVAGTGEKDPAAFGNYKDD